MKRKHFLMTPMVALPCTEFANFAINNKRIKPFKVGDSEDRFHEDSLYRGNHFYLKVSARDTDGELCIYNSTRVKKGGPRLHLHHSQDEWFFILKGEFSFRIGDESFCLKEGDSLFGPREIPHAFALTSEGEGKLMLIYQPAGKIEDFFKEARTSEDLSEEQSKALFRKYGMELLGSPMD